jgi:hypothetical protein
MEGKDLTEKKYSKEDILDFCSNLVFGFDTKDSIGGIYGVSRRFDAWEKIFKNKKE